MAQEKLKQEELYRRKEVIALRKNGRGFLLSNFLRFQFIVNIGALLALYGEYRQIQELGIDDWVSILIGAISNLIIMTCVVGLWKWKLWGYRGLQFMYILGLVLAILSRNLNVIIIHIAMFIMLVSLMDKKYLLE